MPTERIELSPPGLRDQCSASELRRLIVGKILFKSNKFFLKSYAFKAAYQELQIIRVERGYLWD